MQNLIMKQGSYASKRANQTLIPFNAIKTIFLPTFEA